jgi:hypothetical protein
MLLDFNNNGLSKYVAHLLETSVQTIHSLAFNHSLANHFHISKMFQLFYQNNKNEKDMEMEEGVLTSFNNF